MNDSVRFYTTEVSPEKSLQEVMGLLRKYGAQRFEMVWEDGKTTAVRFNLPTPEAAYLQRPDTPETEASRAGVSGWAC